MNNETTQLPPAEPIAPQQEPKLTLKQRLQSFIANITRLARQNKPLAALIALLVVLAIGGGVFALVSSSDDQKTTGEASDNSSNGSLGEQNSATGDQQTTTDPQQNGSPGNNGGTSSGGSTGGGGSGSSGGGSGGGTPAAPAPSTTTFAAPIGYIGGSLTVNATDGYKEMGGTKFWGRAGAYGGGTIDKWAAGINPSNENRKYWNAFNNFHTAANSVGPTKTFWLQLLGRSEKTDDGYYADSVAVINEVKNRIPGVTIYVSAMNGYTQTGVCDLPADAPAQMRRVVSRLVADGKALAGPYIGDISNAQLDSGATQCHANAAGRAVLGAPLKNFFGL